MALFHGSRERRILKALLKALDEVEGNSANIQYDENLVLKGRELAPQLKNGAQLSVMQGYMLSFYRIYGPCVARNPTLVLCSSFGSCYCAMFGLIRFEVETRPDKVVSEYWRDNLPSLESRDTNKLCSFNQCYSNSLLNEISRASLVSESSYMRSQLPHGLMIFLYGYHQRHLVVVGGL